MTKKTITSTLLLDLRLLSLVLLPFLPFESMENISLLWTKAK